MEFLRDPIWQFIGVIVTIAIATIPILIRKRKTPGKSSKDVLRKNNDPEETADIKNDKIEEIFNGLRELGSAASCFLNVGVFCIIRSMSSTKSGACRPLNPEHVVHQIRSMSSTF